MLPEKDAGFERPESLLHSLHIDADKSQEQVEPGTPKAISS